MKIPSGCVFLLAAMLSTGGHVNRSLSQEAAVRPELPFFIRWSNGEALLCADPVLKGDRLEFECRFGSRSIPIDRFRDLDLAWDSPVFAFDRFSVLDRRWSTTGNVAAGQQDNGTLRRCLQMSAGGSIRRALQPAPKTGTLQLVFRESGVDAKDVRTVIAIKFGPNAAQTLKIASGADSAAFQLEVDGLAGWKLASVPRNTSWRRLVVNFATERTVVSIDDSVLGEGPMPKSTALREIFIACESTKTPDVKDASLSIDDFSIAGPPVQVERYLHDGSQADLLAVNGDQTFGQVVGMGSDGVQFKTAGNAMINVAWSDVFSLRAGAPANQSAIHKRLDGPLATLQWVTGERLLGVIATTADGHPVLQHPLLGAIDLTTERSQTIVRRPGLRRVELLVGVRHLGTKIVGAFRDPQPHGISLRTQFELERTPKEATLALWIAGMEGTGPNARFAAKIRTGALQSSLFVNGKKVAVLNDLLVDQSKELMELRVALPVDAFKVGLNEIEIRQTPDPEKGNYDECEVADLAMELTP